MDDLISRQDVLDYIDTMPSELTSDGRRMIRRVRLTEYIADTLPSAERWIPCSERLPEQTGFYLTTFNWYGHLSRSIKYFDGYDFKISTTEIGDVTAWMPMPEPYKEVGSCP